jgi:hypothetical protein
MSNTPTILSSSEPQVPGLVIARAPRHQPPEHTGVPATTMDSGNILDFTQNVRKGIIDSLISKSFVPEDKADKTMLLAALKDMDGQEINKKRLIIEQQGADSSAELVAGVLKRIDARTAFRGTGGPGESVVDVSTKVLPDFIAAPEILPGEGDVLPVQMDYATFMTLQGRSPDAVGIKVDDQDAQRRANKNAETADDWEGINDY